MGWIEEAWTWLLRGEPDGLESGPEWFALPAISRITVSSPHLLKPFRGYNEGRSYADQVSPFNFLLIAHVAKQGHPEGVDENKFHLVSPYRTKACDWLNGPWMDSHTGKRHRVRTGRQMNPFVAQLKTIGDVLRDYRTHPEPKSLGPDGEICNRQTVGLLRRHCLWVVDEDWIGKESNSLEDVQSGLVHDWDEVVEVFGVGRPSRWETVILPMLKRIPVRLLAKETRRTVDYLKRIRNGRQRPAPSLRRKLTLAAFRLMGKDKRSLPR